MTRLTSGDTAPAFTLPNADGEEVSLADFAGGRIIVYFYPAALTPGCTTEAVDFTASLPDLAAAGYQVVGISPDPVERLDSFRTKEALRVTLLSDTERSALEAYGAWGTKMLYGKEITGVIRSTFVVSVDAEGTGTVDKAQYNVKATGHVARLRRDLGV
ncbi:MAG: peroxiredoxin [Propioniciclava sp.]